MLMHAPPVGTAEQSAGPRLRSHAGAWTGPGAMQVKDDCVFKVFLNFLPNRFCFKPGPHELVWKSVTAILHRICVSIFMVFFKFFKIWNQVSRFLILQTPKNVFLGLGTFWHVQ